MMNEIRKSQFNEIGTRRFDKSQYEMLIGCSEKGDLNPWNEWRKNIRGTPILLAGAELGGANLQNVDLSHADLEDADLCKANLRGAELCYANLRGANLGEADLEGAYLPNVNLEYAELWETNLKRAELMGANLKNAELGWANLEDADLTKANLNGADLWKANLKGAKLTTVIVNAKTFIWGCEFDKQTDFTGFGLEQARIDPLLKEGLRSKLRLIQV